MENGAQVLEALEGTATALIGVDFPDLTVKNLCIEFDERGNNYRVHRNPDGSVELKIFLNPKRNDFAALVRRAANSANASRLRKLSVPAELFKKMYQVSADKLSDDERVECMRLMLGGK